MSETTVSTFDATRQSRSTILLYLTSFEGPYPLRVTQGASAYTIHSDETRRQIMMGMLIAMEAKR